MDLLGHSATAAAPLSKASGVSPPIFLLSEMEWRSGVDPFDDPLCLCGDTFSSMRERYSVVSQGPAPLGLISSFMQSGSEAQDGGLQVKTTFSRLN